MKKEKIHSFADYFEIIIKWRKVIIRNVIMVTVTAVIISLLLPSRFTATTTILPPSTEQNTMLGMMMSNIPSGLSSFAQAGGILPGVSTPSDLFAAILASGTVKGAIIQKFDLRNEFKVKTMTDASKALEDITIIEVSPEGIISVSVTYTDKFLAAELANAYIEELDMFNNETAMTAGKKYRIFIENRLSETEKALANAEDSLKAFQEKHKTVALDVEIQSAIQTVAELKSQVLLLEAKKGALESASRINNPYLFNIEKELRSLKKQLKEIEFGDDELIRSGFGAGFSMSFSELPEITLEYARLLREVKIQEAIYELLTQQFEQAKIMELKDTPTVQLLDKAGPPERKSYPKRAKIVITAFFLSIVAGLGLVIIFEHLEYMKLTGKDKKWRNIGQVLKNDIVLLKKKISRKRNRSDNNSR